jgi:hypothetical protein
MRRLNWQAHPDMLMVINILLLVSLLGFLSCVAAYITDWSELPKISLIIYGLWFAMSMGSFFLMKRGDAWAAYMLMLGTIFVGIYELGKGIATFGGAILALSVLFLLLYYLFRIHQLDDENERISSPS